MATQNAYPKFNLSEIPESSQLALLSIVHDEVVAYFKQPGVAEKFARWQAERERKRTERKCNK